MKSFFIIVLKENSKIFFPYKFLKVMFSLTWLVLKTNTVNKKKVAQHLSIILSQLFKTSGGSNCVYGVIYATNCC